MSSRSPQHASTAGTVLSTVLDKSRVGIYEREASGRAHHGQVRAQTSRLSTVCRRAHSHRSARLTEASTGAHKSALQPALHPAHPHVSPLPVPPTLTPAAPSSLPQSVAGTHSRADLDAPIERPQRGLLSRQQQKLSTRAPQRTLARSRAIAALRASAPATIGAHPRGSLGTRAARIR